MRKFKVINVKNGELMGLINALLDEGFELYEGDGLKPIISGPTELEQVYQTSFSSKKAYALKECNEMFERLSLATDVNTGCTSAESLTDQLVITSHNCNFFTLSGSLKNKDFLVNLEITARHNRAYIEVL